MARKPGQWHLRSPHDLGDTGFSPLCRKALRWPTSTATAAWISSSPPTSRHLSAGGVPSSPSPVGPDYGDAPAPYARPSERRRPPPSRRPSLGALRDDESDGEQLGRRRRRRTPTTTASSSGCCNRARPIGDRHRQRPKRARRRLRSTPGSTSTATAVGAGPKSESPPVSPSWKAYNSLTSTCRPGPRPERPPTPASASAPPAI